MDHTGHSHPTELHRAICENVGNESHRKACIRYDVSNTTLSGWINDGNPIGMDADRQALLVELLDTTPYEVLRMHGMFDLRHTGELGPSFDSPLSRTLKAA